MDNITSKLLQYITSIAGGLVIAFESTINFIVPCFIAILMDVYAAWNLGRRLHKKYPDNANGKFKSSGKWRILQTMIVVFLAMIMANYIDVYVLKNTDISVRFVVGVFLFYQIWSCLENWSSENDNKFAMLLQRFMVNKAERHLQVPLSDILLPDDKNVHDDNLENNIGGDTDIGDHIEQKGV